MGSVRLPAAYCGLVGLKPSYSLISTRGVVPLSYGLDHVDPLCRSARYISLMLDVLTGYDAACVESVYPHCALHERPVNLAGLRFAVPLNDAATSFGKGIWENFIDHVTKLEDHGAIQVSCSLPYPDPTRSHLAGLLICGAGAGHAPQGALLTSPGDFSKDFRKMLGCGRDATAHHLVATQRHLVAVGLRFRKLFDEADLLLLPTAPQTAFPFEQLPLEGQADLTQWANHAGCPALSLPCGLSPDGMPLGLQLIGPPLADGQLLAMAQAIQPLLPQLTMPELEE